MNIKSLFLIIAIAAIALSCNSSTGPFHTVQKFWEAIDKGDVRFARLLIAKRTIDEVGATKYEQEAKNETINVQYRGGIKSVTLQKEEIVGDAAKVLARIVYGKDNLTYDVGHIMSKENGEWKIVKMEDEVLISSR
jgi:hypothetical protein